MYNEFPMPLNTEKIEQLRERAGLTQQQAAIKAGFSGRAYWCDIVRGRKSNVTIEVLEAIAKALGVDPRDLIQ